MAAIPELDRRRLLEVRGLHPAVPVLVLHPLLTVVTGFGRDASDTVVECLGRLGAPLGPAVTGSAEIGGRILELPGALADPDARPEVVRSPMIVGELARRRAAEAAVDLSQRAARVSRREAGLARRDQLVDRLDHLSSRADALEQQLHPKAAIDDEEIQRLLAAARVRDSGEPNPIVTALLEEWDALVAERKAGGSGPTTDRAEANLDATRARIAERRLAAAGGADSDVLDAAGVARVQELHGEVERLSASLDEGRRSERRAAGPKVVAALDAEREALAELGFDSYPAFLLAMAEGRAEDDSKHDAAALQTAESALVRARERETVFVALSERELDLRARVARLLGRLPGPDVGADLRNGREALPVAGAIERLETALRNAGIPVGDPVESAERWLEGVEARRAQRSALMAELAEIESEGCRLDEQLEQAENELAAAERELIAGVSGSLAGREAPLVLSAVTPDELGSAIATLVAPAGPPLVVGECFTELSPLACAALLEVLAETSRRRQVIIVTEHEGVGTWAQGLGLDGVVWTPVEAEKAQRAMRAGRAALETAFEKESVQTEPERVEAPVEVAQPAAEVDDEILSRAEVEALFASQGAEVEVEDVPEPVAADEPTAVVDAPEPEVASAPDLVDVPETPEVREVPEPVEAPAPPPPIVRIVPDLVAPEAPVVPEPRVAPEPPVVPQPPAPTAPVVREQPEVEKPAVEKPAASDTGSVTPMVGRGRKRRKPALFDVEATEAAEAAEEAKTAKQANRRNVAEPIEAKVVEARPVEARPVEARPDEARPVESRSEPEAERKRAAASARPAAPAPPATASPAASAPAPSRAEGPWKSKRARRKREAEAAKAPWEGRFDTSRERAIPGRVQSAVSAPPGTEPLAVCVRHRGVLTRSRCARCSEPMCDECFVTPRGRKKPICIECAILESGVRKRRRKRS